MHAVLITQHKEDEATGDQRKAGQQSYMPSASHSRCLCSMRLSLDACYATLCHAKQGYEYEKLTELLRSHLDDQAALVLHVVVVLLQPSVQEVDQLRAGGVAPNGGI